MAASPTNNRSMFWRIVRRLLIANPTRLCVILLALGAGAAVTAALLNLQFDAKSRLTREFRIFGPNVLVLPKGSSLSGTETLPESAIRSIPRSVGNAKVGATSSLYVIAKVSSPQSEKSSSAVIVGSSPRLIARVVPLNAGPNAAISSGATPVCMVGGRIGKQLQVQQDAPLTLSNGDATESCLAAGLGESGGPEDDRIGADLHAAQRLANLPGRINMIELNVPGTPAEIENYIANLQRLLRDAEVRPIRQFTEAQGRIFSRISGLLNFTVALVLILTALCVLAAMTNVAMERRNDVGLMKAIGGSVRRVLRFFLAEAALLGLVSGLIGAAAGILLSMELGKAIFGIAARPRLIVYPVSVILTMMVAIVSALPLRRLANIRPSVVFRGEA